VRVLRSGSALSSTTATEPLRAGREALQSLCNSPETMPCALAFANDLLCAGALFEAQDRGIRVPQALALLGFGDFPLSRELGHNADTLQHGLSTVDVQRSSIGTRSAQAVLHALGLHTAPISSDQVTPEVLQRSSS
jgi:LacI family transcriptional regulator, gluconate utilization system Gnt-I transcriptional repressor